MCTYDGEEKRDAGVAGSGEGCVAAAVGVGGGVFGVEVLGAGGGLGGVGEGGGGVSFGGLGPHGVGCC